LTVKVGRPNIVFLFSDQQRWDTLGCYGQSLPVTPNLDRMAAEGVRFSHAFTCQPVCGPARAALQTGLYPTATGCFRNGIALPLEQKTIAHHLGSAGYQLGYIGKWHLASSIAGYGPGEDTGFNFHERPVPPERRGGYGDYWLASDVLEFTSHGYDGYLFDREGRKIEFPGGRYRPDALTDFALEYLTSGHLKRPFFLFVSYVEPHHQNDRRRHEGPHGSAEQFKGFDVPGDLVGTEGDWRREFPEYLGACHSLDQNVGRIRSELERLHLAQQTVLFYTSDHGSHFRTRNSEYKRSCHDASIRIPLLAAGPGFEGGRVVEELVSLIDLPPTLMEIAGVPPFVPLHGRALQPLVSGDATAWPREAFVQISESQVGRCVRTARWKYSVRAPNRDGWREPDSETYTEEFLYDLEADPHERANLVTSPDYGPMRNELASVLKQRMREAGEREWVIVPG
jgi:uncharacterized sulfatase